MAMGSGDRGRGTLNEINVTPLVDVMLVLLIVFMVTTPIIVDQMQPRKVEVELPKTSAEPLKSDDLRNLILNLHANYHITWTDGDTTLPFPGVDCTTVKDGNFSACLTALEESLKKNPKVQEEQRLFLQADRRLPYGFVVDVMSRVRKAGIPHLGMVTNPPDGAPQ